MRWKALLLAGCAAAFSGCLMAENTARNLFNEPTELLDNKKLSRQLRHESKAAWGEVCRQYPKRTFTVDYADGFTDGFVDHLESGGTAQPPAAPPVKYRRSRYMNVEGHARIQDYFCGFKYGCDVAAASGQRDLITVPILLPEPPADAPVQARQIPIEAARPLPKAVETPSLPKPKTVDMGIGLPLLDRPLAAQPAPPYPTEAPTATIPVIGAPEPKPDGPPKFSAPTFDFSNSPRSHVTPSDTIVPAAFKPSPSSGVVLPLRELPNSAAKPLRTIPDSRPIPPWRGD